MRLAIIPFIYATIILTHYTTLPSAHAQAEAILELKNIIKEARQFRLWAINQGQPIGADIYIADINQAANRIARIVSPTDIYPAPNNLIRSLDNLIQAAREAVSGSGGIITQNEEAVIAPDLASRLKIIQAQREMLTHIYHAMLRLGGN